MGLYYCLFYYSSGEISIKHREDHVCTCYPINIDIERGTEVMRCVLSNEISDTWSVHG